MNGPKLWLPLLTEVKRVYGSAVVAGGACRDWAVNKNINPRDIDIFVQAESELDFEMLLSTVALPGAEAFPRMRLIGPDDMSYPTGEQNANNIIAVALGHFGFERESRPINIIAKTYDPSDTARLFKDFDHSLCQFAYDGDVSLVSTDAAKETLDTKAIAVLNECDRTYERLRNLTSRNKSYAAFTFEDKGPAKVTATKFDYDKYRELFDEIVHRPIAMGNAPLGRWVFNNVGGREVANWEVIR